MKKKIVPIVPEKLGNNRQISPSKNWIFTCNNYTDEKINMIVTDSSIKRYSFQEEIGESGTPHLQGYLEFITKRRPLSVFPNLGAHFIKCKFPKEAIAYTQKTDTRAGKLYLKGIKKIRPLKCLSKDQLYTWQNEIVELAEEEPDDRLIYWFYEPNGCKGKSQLCRYLVINHGALLVGGDAKDMMYQIASQKESPDIILINLSHNAKQPDLIALEAIKDGLFASPKYESKMYIMNPPHIFIFGNREPIFKEDGYDNSTRWVVKQLD